MAANRPPSDEPYPDRWRAFGFLLFASAMNLIDLTVVNIGIPSIDSDLQTNGPRGQGSEWIVASYGLAFGLGLITGGRLGDIYGRRVIFTLGIGGFVLGSMICGLASSFEVLVGGRVVQGTFAALMMPQVLASVGVLFPMQERFKAMAMYGAVIGAATISGPLFGALLVQFDILGLDWRPIFLVNLPLGLAALIGVLKYLPDSRGEHPPTLDLAGMALLSIALALLLYPLVELPAHADDQDYSPWTIVSLIASLPAFAAFVFYESRYARSPLVPLSLFRRRAFSGGMVVNLLFTAGLAGYSLVLMLTLQIGLEFTPILAAVTVLPFSIGIALSARKSFKLVPRFGGRMLLFYGVVLVTCGMAISLAVVQWAGADLTNWELIPGSFVSGLGLGLVTPIIAGVVLSEIDPRDAGSAAGVLSTAAQLGAGLGLATVSTTFFALLPDDPSRVAADPATTFTDALGIVLIGEVAIYAFCALVILRVMPGLPKPAPEPPPEPAAPAAAAPPTPVAAGGGRD